MKVGQKVRKVSGYQFPSTIVSIFKTTKGEERMVCELEGYGLLHIFSPSQLERVLEYPDKYKSVNEMS